MPNPIVPPLILLLLSIAEIAGTAAIGSAAATILSDDFEDSGGDFTSSFTRHAVGNWAYDPRRQSWVANGSDIGIPSSKYLSTEWLTVPESGILELTFEHRYSFEFDGIRWDGGAVLFGANDGPFMTLLGSTFLRGGYTGTIQGNNDLFGGEAFNANSIGYEDGEFITSVARLGSFDAGGTVRIRFAGAWDEFSRGDLPNWEITRVQLRVIPEPMAAALLFIAFGVGAANAGRRRRLGIAQP